MCAISIEKLQFGAGILKQIPLYLEINPRLDLPLIKKKSLVLTHYKLNYSNWFSRTPHILTIRINILYIHSC